MPSPTERVARGQRFPRFAAALAAAVGLAVLAGWKLGVPVLTGLAPGLTTMKANTAVCFIFTGASLWIFATPGGPSRRTAGLALGLAMAITGAATVSQDLIGWDIGIDQAIAIDADTASPAAPGRMAPATAACFVLLGSALALQRGSSLFARRLGHTLSFTVAVVAYLVLLGYAYGVTAVYRVGPYNSVALHTAATFLVAAIATIWLRPVSNILQVVTTELPAGWTIRRLLAAAFVVPALLASLFLLANRGWRLAPESLLALLVTSCGLVFAGLIWWSSRELIATLIARSLSERALTRSEERFRKAFDASPAAISISTLSDGRYLDVNDRFGRLLGHAPDDVRGRTSSEIGFWTDPDDRAAMLQMLQREGSVRDMEVAIRRKSGEVLSILLSATEVEFDGQACLLALCYDVTELKKAEHALRESEASLRKAQEVAQVGSWTIDLADPGRAVSWSRETHRVCGTDASGFEPSIDGFLALVHPSDREALELAVRASLKERAPFDLEHRIVRPDGSFRWVREQAEVIRDQSGLPTRMVGTIQDITQRRQLERQLAQSQKMEAVGRLAGGIAHDFNNLLSVILGYGELVVRKVGDEDARRKVREILKAGERAAGLTRQLLAFSRRQVMVAEVLDLTQVVTGITNMLRRLIGEDVELTTVFQPGAGKVQADRGQLEQVIVNLAVNGRDAMPQGGKLVIEVQEVRVDRAFVKEQVTVPAGDYAVLSVRDTGTGMDAETRSHVFEPFFTTKGEGRGTGLGLATVYGIVKQSGGFVWVQSEPGQGSTFKIYLPRVEAGLPELSGTSPPAASPRGSETILLAEDEDALRGLSREVLESYGYHVLEARGGEEALEEARRHGGRIDLLLTDVVMPGQSGRELAEKLTAEHAAVKVLYMSGYTDDMVLRRGVLTEGTAFIQKPFTPDSLVRRVRAVLDGTELDREPV